MADKKNGRTTTRSMEEWNNEELKTGKILTKIMEIAGYCGMVLCAALLIWGLISTDSVMEVYEGENLTMYGADLDLENPELKNPTAAISVMLLTGAVSSAMMALTFRRANGIIVKAIEGAPFQACTVKWMKQIGYLAILAPIVGFVGTLIAFLAGGLQTGEVMLNLDGFIMGILMLCLTQVFAYGVNLQQDVDGLL